MNWSKYAGKGEGLKEKSQECLRGSHWDCPDNHRRNPECECDCHDDSVDRFGNQNSIYGKRR